MLYYHRCAPPHAVAQGAILDRSLPRAPSFTHTRQSEPYRELTAGRAELPPMNGGTEEPAVFTIDWLRGAIPVEKEFSVLATKDEAITAAKTRAPDVARRHSGREPLSVDG